VPLARGVKGCYDVNMSHTKVFLVLLLSSLVVCVAPSPARAEGSAAAFGTGVLQCFHPDAEFVSLSFSGERGTAGGHRAWAGWIKFHDAEEGVGLVRSRRDAVMAFVLDSRVQDGVTMVRITPTSDDGLMSPAQGCYLREWQRGY